MDKFTQHRGVCAPLLRDNIDTDAIIPSREMRSVSKTGLSAGLFAAWRYTNALQREPNPDFVLNKPQYTGASILAAGENFGCGSSREHAVWALKEYGFRCIIAQSFGAIFYRNCASNGILPVVLSAQHIQSIVDDGELDINLETQTIKSVNTTLEFSVSENEKRVLLNGLDPISETLLQQELIDNFREMDATRRPWV